MSTFIFGQVSPPLSYSVSKGEDVLFLIGIYVYDHRLHSRTSLGNHLGHRHLFASHSIRFCENVDHNDLHTHSFFALPVEFIIVNYYIKILVGL